MVTTPTITSTLAMAQAAQATAIATMESTNNTVYATRPDKDGCYGLRLHNEAVLKGRITRFDLQGEDVYLRAGIRQIISSEPMLTAADSFSSQMHESKHEHVKMYAAGELHYPRLKGLHSLLCRGRSPHEITAVENGCGANPHLTMALTSMGTKVFVIEPDDFMIGTHFGHSRRYLPAEWISRMVYIFDDESVIPADIVYWINPTPSMFRHLSYHSGRTPRNLGILVDYMGRNVVRGGFLVLQTPEALYHDLYFDHSKWIPLFDSANNVLDEIDGIAFPTDLPYDQTYLRIFRRIA